MSYGSFSAGLHQRQAGERVPVQAPLGMGDAILKAKSRISDADVRKTYVLFGDPAMQVKQPEAQ